MIPSDLTLLAACGRPALTPDGATAVVAVSAPDVAVDAVTASLWAVPVEDPAAARPLTAPLPGRADSAPATSPDGAWVAFLRAPRGGRPQLHLVPVAGGEPVAVSTDEQHPLGAGAPVWSPDGTSLAHVARVPEAGRYGTDPDVGPDAEPPRRITTLSYRLDGVGHTADRPRHVAVLDVSAQLAAAHPTAGAAGAEAPGAGPVSRVVTGGAGDDADVTWGADGGELLFTSDRHEGSDRDQRRGVWAVRPDGTGLRQVVGGDLEVAAVQPAPDGASVLLLAQELGPDGVDFVARQTGLFLAPLHPGTGAGAGAPQRLTDELAVDLGDVGSHLTATPAGVLVQERRRGAVRLLRVPLDGGAPEVLVGGAVVVQGHAASADGSRVVVSAADPQRLADLALVRAPGPDAAADRGPSGDPDDPGAVTGAGALTWLTDVAAPLRARGVRAPREITATSRDGNPVHGWVVLPDPARWGAGPHPALLTIHGGPFSQYGWGLFDEAQVLAGAGYAVVMGNPRGSAGYGYAHGAAVRGAMGTVDADDVIALLDAALADPALGLDPGRVGVQGGSYGGYLTALLTTRTHRFAAAVVERGYLDAPSFVGSSDIGAHFPQQYHRDAARMVEQSPMTHVGAVRTPTLVIHSEQDWRCPVDQGMRWYGRLKLAGVETELLLFPGEGHELTRSGRPRHRVARFEHVLRWWGEHLPVG